MARAAMGRPDIRALVRETPDFPKPGILFRDMSPLLREPGAWSEVMRQLGAVCERLQPELIVGIESRGFIVGSALAAVQGLGFVPVRKPGKLPGAVTAVDYELEYGSDRLEIHSDSLQGGTRPSAVVQDGDQLITTIHTTLVQPGTTLHYELSGQGIGVADVASGPLLGQATVTEAGEIRLSHTMAADNLNNDQATLEIRIFLDADRTVQVGQTARVTMDDTSEDPGYGGRRVLVVDDLLATGGTARAAADLIQSVGGELCGFAFVIELADLGGKQKLPAGVPVESLIVY
jgi:adenine phosphoribosyltransferase